MRQKLTGQITRLHWGCGDLRPKGWINADIHYGAGIDVTCDIIVDGLPFATDTIDLIYCSPALGVFPVHEVAIVLCELNRVLKPEGLLRLGVPDFKRAIDAFRNRDDTCLWCWEWDTLDGNFLTQLTNYGYARTLFTRKFVDELLRKAGFSGIHDASFRYTPGGVSECVELDRRAEECLYMEAYKPAKRTCDSTGDDDAPSQIHLSWVESPGTSLTVSWSAPVPHGEYAVEYRCVDAESWNRVPAERKLSLTRNNLFGVTVGNLQADTEYEYRITSTRNGSKTDAGIFQTRTAPAGGSSEYRFVFFCDTGLIGRPDGNASGTRQIMEEIEADQPLFILGGGDYAYANHDGRYTDVGDAIDGWFIQMQPLLSRFPLMAQYGNHEIYLKERYRDWAPRFAHPPGFDDNRNYSFTIGDVHFCSLFVTGNRLNAKQLAWLEAELSDARYRGVTWLIVYQHEPIFAHGHSHPAKSEYRQFLAPLFERYRVDLHLSGHDQNYERTYPLLGAAGDPIKVSDSLDCYTAGAGVIYAKVSPGGKKSESGNDFSRFTVAQQAFMATRDDASHHYARVSVRPCGELAVDVFGVAGDGSRKVLVDSFRIVAAKEVQSGNGRSSIATKRVNRQAELDSAVQSDD